MSNLTTNSTTPPGYAEQNLYGYNPSTSAAYGCLALFAIAGVTHFILMFPYRAAFFIPLVLGCAVEAGGYYFRVVSSTNTKRILPFVLQGLMILAAPPLLAATIYMTFGRIIWNLKAESCSLVSPKWLTFLFVLGDLTCLATQLAGSVLRADTDPTINARGNTLVLGGLVLQAIIFFLFALLALVFQSRFRRFESIELLPWRRHLIVLYVLSVVFIVRNAVRIVEFKQPADGFIANLI